MSAIMRRRRSLIGLSLIEGSCPEVGVWNPSILRTGRPPSHRLSINRSAPSLAACSAPRAAFSRASISAGYPVGAPGRREATRMSETVDGCEFGFFGRTHIRFGLALDAILGL